MNSPLLIISKSRLLHYIKCKQIPGVESRGGEVRARQSGGQSAWHEHDRDVCRWVVHRQQIRSTSLSITSPHIVAVSQHSDLLPPWVRHRSSSVALAAALTVL